MKILYITSADFDTLNAPTVRARALARALVAQGCRVTVLGIHGNGQQEPCLYRRVRYPPVRYLGQGIYQATLFARLMAEQRPDLILLREMPFCVQPYLLRRPIFLEVNGLALEESKQSWGISRWSAESLYRWGYRNAFEILALTPSIKDYLVRQIGLSPAKVSVVSNAVEVDRFYPIDSTEARRMLGLPEHVPIVFYVGSYHRQHGIPNIVRAAELLHQRKVACLFLLAGHGSTREAKIRELVQERQITSRFRFLGSIDDDTLRTAIGASDVCLNPASNETRVLTDATFPQKLLEYLACGRPVISIGNSPYIRNLIEGYKLGMVIPHDTDGGARLADMLEKFITKKELLSQMGGRGCELVRSQYSYQKVVLQYLSRFRRVLQ